MTSRCPVFSLPQTTMVPGTSRSPCLRSLYMLAYGNRLNNCPLKCALLVVIQLHCCAMYCSCASNKLPFTCNKLAGSTTVLAVAVGNDKQLITLQSPTANGRIHFNS